MAGKIATAFAVNPAGRVVSQTDEQSAAATANGYTPTTGDDYRGQLKASADEKYVDEHWGAAGKLGAGVASGLSLGLAPALATRMGLLDPGHLEAAEQDSLFTAGDVAGTIAPALLSGGESLAARGAAAEGSSLIGRALRLGTPAGWLGEAGGAAERLVGHFASEAGIMGKLGAPALRMAARGATEGALINISHTAADEVIQNKPLSAQALLISGADGALFGGLTGGILGGASAAAGAGLDLVGGRVASSAIGRGVEGKAGTALGQLGAGEGKLAELAARDGDLVTSLKGFHKVLEGEGLDIASGTGAIKHAAGVAERKYAAIAADAVEQLQKEAPSVLDGRLSQMGDRIRKDLTIAYQGTLEQREVARVWRDVSKDLQGMKTWEHWAKTREQLADAVQGTSGPKQAVYKTTLNAFDNELTSAMQRANPELAAQYAAATVGKRQASELLEMSGKKAASEAGRTSSLHMNGADAATLGYSVLAGANPLVGAGIIAGKKIVSHVQEKLAPHIGEAAYRSAIGATAGHATVNIGKKVSETMARFMTGGRIAASKSNADAYSAKPKLSYSMKSYEKALEDADRLTSEAHMAKVREMTEALSQAGHPDLANEMALTYGRAAAYVSAAKKGLKDKDVHKGSLGKLPKAMGLSTQGMKLLTIMDGIRNPMGIIEKLDAGDVPSRAAVAAVKYVYPDFHQDVVMRATQQIMAMKEEGKFLPADKIAALGTVLDAPVDSKLEKGYIDQVQQGLAANKAPPPNEGDAPPPTTDVSSFQTPLQASV